LGRNLRTWWTDSFEIGQHHANTINFCAFHADMHELFGVNPAQAKKIIEDLDVASAIHVHTL
jgi:hypothetical protein